MDIASWLIRIWQITLILRVSTSGDGDMARERVMWGELAARVRMDFIGWEAR